MTPSPAGPDGAPAGQVPRRREAETIGTPPGPGERLAVMFTSGTTSQPKGVVLTQANYAFTGDVMARHCWYAQNLTAAQYDGISGLLGCRPRQLYGRTETGPAVITKRPREIRFVPELPRTSVGKVRKFLLTGGQRRS